MTRINCIPTEDLLDQHLLAEYNEMAMALASLRRSKASGKPLPKGKTYTLGPGHVIFFYDKGKFLKRRYESLKTELLRRGFRLNENRRMEWEVYDDPALENDWQPSEEDQKVNVERILQRMLLKPSWYKYERLPIDAKAWEKKYSDWAFKPL
jgi:deoxyribonuclease (pyrimidine dimer)